MKTRFVTTRICITENTEVEIERSVAFYLDDVVRWEQGNEDTFKSCKNTTIIHFAEDCLYIKISWKEFDKIMTQYNERKGDLIIKMKQN